MNLVFGHRGFDLTQATLLRLQRRLDPVHAHVHAATQRVHARHQRGERRLDAVHAHVVSVVQFGPRRRGGSLRGAGCGDLRLRLGLRLPLRLCARFERGVRPRRRTRGRLTGVRRVGVVHVHGCQCF